MKERSISLCGPEVRAILEGRKTQTRRTCKPAEAAALSFVVDCDDGKWGDEEGDVLFRCPYGQPGDRLWVREAWRVPAGLDDLSGKQIAEKCLAAGYREPWCPVKYEADGSPNKALEWLGFGNPPGKAVPGRYRQARFMPRWMSRITLEVTAVRVERLQDISRDDAAAEGIQDLTTPEHIDFGIRGVAVAQHPVRAFQLFWESLYGGSSWYANPFVWVVSFKHLRAVK